MKRHNRICTALIRILRASGWKTFKEKKFITSKGKVGVPDIVAVKRDRALIVDVTVPMNNKPKTLKKAAASKVEKYWSFKKSVKRTFPKVKKVTVWGFPVGAKGKWHEGNMKFLETVGVRLKKRMKTIAKCCIKLALWGTINICKKFLSRPM